MYMKHKFDTIGLIKFIVSLKNDKVGQIAFRKTKIATMLILMVYLPLTTIAVLTHNIWNGKLMILLIILMFLSIPKYCKFIFNYVHK